VFNFDSGYVSSNVYRLTYNFVALSLYCSFTVYILALASVTTMTTVQKTPMTAYTLSL
jgi:hypothetical protein